MQTDALSIRPPIPTLDVKLSLTAEPEFTVTEGADDAPADPFQLVPYQPSPHIPAMAFSDIPLSAGSAFKNPPVSDDGQWLPPDPVAPGTTEGTGNEDAVQWPSSPPLTVHVQVSEAVETPRSKAVGPDDPHRLHNLGELPVADWVPDETVPRNRPATDDKAPLGPPSSMVRQEKTSVDERTLPERQFQARQPANPPLSNLQVAQGSGVVAPMPDQALSVPGGPSVAPLEPGRSGYASELPGLVKETPPSPKPDHQPTTDLRARKEPGAGHERPPAKDADGADQTRNHELSKQANRSPERSSSQSIVTLDKVLVRTIADSERAIMTARSEPGTRNEGPLAKDADGADQAQPDEFSKQANLSPERSSSPSIVTPDKVLVRTIADPVSASLKATTEPNIKGERPPAEDTDAANRILPHETNKQAISTVGQSHSRLPVFTDTALVRSIPDPDPDPAQDLSARTGQSSSRISDAPAMTSGTVAPEGSAPPAGGERSRHDDPSRAAKDTQIAVIRKAVGPAVQTTPSDSSAGKSTPQPSIAVTDPPPRILSGQGTVSLELTDSEHFFPNQKTGPDIGIKTHQPAGASVIRYNLAASGTEDANPRGSDAIAQTKAPPVISHAVAVLQGSSSQGPSPGAFDPSERPLPVHPDSAHAENLLPEPIGKSTDAGLTVTNGPAPTPPVGKGLAHGPSQVFQALVQAHMSGHTGQSEILLRPEELGKIRFDLQTSADRVQVILYAERPDTMELMRRYGEQLLHDLRQAGFGQATLEFGQWAQRDGRARYEFSNSGQLNDAQGVPETPGQRGLAQTKLPDGRLNLRL